jgi:hypothetical protein
MKLAPEKIAGVVLCGNLREMESLLLQSHPDLSEEGPFAIDAFLKQYLPCPFAIAWDGEGVDYSVPLAVTSGYDASSPAECLKGHRCFILGGGIAPHRRQPETFSWTLTRFVEDSVAPSIPISEKKKMFRRVKKERSDTDSIPLPRMDGGFFHKFVSGDYFSFGSFVVYGRVIASAILYATILKVGVYQYGNFLDGMVNMKTRYDTAKSLPRRLLKLVSGFFLNYGYISHLFRRQKPERSDFTGPQDELLTQDKLNQDGKDGSTEEGEADKASGEEANNEEEEVPADDATAEEDNPDDGEDGEPEQEDESEPESEGKRRFEPPPFFLLDRVIASDGHDAFQRFKT